MAEGDGLENRYTRKGIKGSNPLLSAKCCLPVGLTKIFPIFLRWGWSSIVELAQKTRWRYVPARYVGFLA